VFWPQIRRTATLRNLGISIAAFVVGASPFLLYNIRRPNRTLSANAHVELRAAELSAKLHQLRASFKGNTLFGYLVTEEWRGSPKDPASAVGRASVWLRDR